MKFINRALILSLMAIPLAKADVVHVDTSSLDAILSAIKKYPAQTAIEVAEATLVSQDMPITLTTVDTYNASWYPSYDKNGKPVLSNDTDLELAIKENIAARLKSRMAALAATEPTAEPTATSTAEATETTAEPTAAATEPTFETLPLDTILEEAILEEALATEDEVQGYLNLLAEGQLTPIQVIEKTNEEALPKLANTKDSSGRSIFTHISQNPSAKGNVGAAQVLLPFVQNTNDLLNDYDTVYNQGPLDYLRRNITLPEAQLIYKDFYKAVVPSADDHSIRENVKQLGVGEENLVL